MLKITKGLKKKKKGKKSKHKEDDLFDSAELEEYRRQQQEKKKEGGEEEKEEPNVESEEWLKFKALTSGVDDILKKTQGDLDRIKSTSYFQKKPPGPSEPPKVAQSTSAESAPVQKSKWVGFEEGGLAEDEESKDEKDVKSEQTQEQTEEHVEEEEGESEFEDEQDDIFDTSFVDVVASGEVKLAYVPDSPIELLSGPDPFDTSIVDKVIKLDPKEQKRNLVNLGCAVEVLTGKLDKSPCKEKESTLRKRPKAQDLLLGSFDEGDLKPVVVSTEPEPKSILDDDPVFEEETSAVLGLPPVTPITESKPICPVKQAVKNENLKELFEEFVPTLGVKETDSSLAPEEDDLDDEFAILAAESLSKKVVPARPQPPVLNSEKVNVENEDPFIDGDDPFDTSFASEILPGKFELKLIEKEILEKEIPLQTNSVEDQIKTVLQNSEPSVKFSPGNGQDLFNDDYKPLSLKHRDLLEGSTTDLTKIDQSPIVPKSVSEELTFNVADPFDTSIAESFVVPGKTELKVLEKELLERKQPAVTVDIDNEFDPRAEEKPTNNNKPPPPRPDNLSVGKRASIPKVVAFDVEFSKVETDLLAVGQEENCKIGKPLTPFYPPKQIEETKNFEDGVDPFDTTHVINCPGKVELQILEKDLVQEVKSLKHSLSDPDFDPRGTEVKLRAGLSVAVKDSQPDILSEEVIVDTKLHTPVAPKKFVEVSPANEKEIDPFDTSIANTLIPGKAEIKILESELIHSQEIPQLLAGTSILEKLRRDSDSFSSLHKHSIADVLELPLEDDSVKPLTPLGPSSSFEHDEDADPFDTSGIGDILPEEVGTTQLPSSNSNFNPFLAGNDVGESDTDNPFMSGFVDSQNVFESPNLGTNPFALGSDSATETNFFSNQQGSDQSSINFDNIFSSQPQAEVDLFSQVPSQKNNNFIQDDLIPSTEATSNIFCSGYESGFEDADKKPPRRPPPPRPGPPKETKDLILSVTGAMEATSSHLLDRLQATRTPSPTPMRDLHSPSPTQFGDLLEVDEPSGITGPISQPEDVNFLGDDFDFTPSQPQEQESVKRPSMDDGTMAPITPVPLEAEHVAPVAPVAKPAMPPSRPPPSIPERPKLPPQPPRPPIPSRPKTPETTPSSTPNQVMSPPQPVVPQEENLMSDQMNFDDVFGIGIQSAASTDQQTPIVPPDAAQAQNISSTDMMMNNAPIITGAIHKVHQGSFETEMVNNNEIFEEPFKESVSIITDGVQPLGAPLSPVLTNIPPTTPPAPPPTANVITEEKSVDIFDIGFSEAVNANKASQPLKSDDFFDVSQSDSVFGNESSSQQVPNEFTQEELPQNVPPNTSQPFNIFDAFGSNSSQCPQKAKQDDFDEFAAKFESAGLSDVAVKADPFDPFSSGFGRGPAPAEESMGFGTDDNFDSFLSLREPPPVPQGTPARISRGESAESNEDNDFNIFIKPKSGEDKPGTAENLPSLAPPPKSPSQSNAFQDSSPRFNPFDNTQEVPFAAVEDIFPRACINNESRIGRTDSQETPPTPLFDEDVSQPLEDFPRIHYDGPGWDMQLRQPNKKKITGQRFWKKIFIKLVQQGETPVLQLFNSKDDKDPFQELPLQPCYSVSEIGAQQYDQFGKIFTVKLQFIFYKERPGVRPGQVTKAERITNKLSQFAAYAIQGDYQGVKEFGSDLKKLGLPVEHAPQISQLFKIGSQTYEDMKQFSMCVEEALFRITALRDRALVYKMEEVQITAVDELYVEQNANGGVDKQIARVRLFFLGFLSGNPDVELGVNDLVRQGKEVVGRHDIIPVVTEEWIRLECVEFHTCVQQDDYEKTRTIKFKPPDACYIELMRFRIRPPKNRELPLQLKVSFCITGNKVEIHGDILVPGFSSRKLGQIPCEDVMVRIPIPECWIYQFRVEKHFRYGSVKSAHRRTGKVKGIERFLGAVENMEPSLMETTSGVAKYEHQHRSIVWRMPRLPKEGQGAYTTHNLVVRLQLTSYDQVPDELAKYAYVEFTMPATTVSHTTVRSVSIQNSDSDTPPEKYVRQLSRHEYRVEIEHTQGEGPGDYIAATVTTKPVTTTAITEEPRIQAPPPASESDSDSG